MLGARDLWRSALFPFILIENVLLFKHTTSSNPHLFFLLLLHILILILFSFILIFHYYFIILYFIFLYSFIFLFLFLFFFSFIFLFFLIHAPHSFPSKYLSLIQNSINTPYIFFHDWYHLNQLAKTNLKVIFLHSYFNVLKISVLFKLK